MIIDLLRSFADAKSDLLTKKTKTQSTSNGISTDQVDVKPLVKHILSKELQMYFERITDAIVSEDERLRSQAFESLRNDPGLHQLLPYFVQHIQKKVIQNHKNLDVMDAMLSTVYSILNNEHLFVEPYVSPFQTLALWLLTLSLFLATPTDSFDSVMPGGTKHLRTSFRTRPLEYKGQGSILDIVDL